MKSQSGAAISSWHGDPAGILERSIASLPRLRRSGNAAGVALALCAMGRAHTLRGEWDEAEACFEEAVELAELRLDPRLEGAVALGVGELHLRRRNERQARLDLERAIGLLSGHPGSGDLARALKLMGVLSRRRNDAATAIDQLDEALTVARTAADPVLEAEIQGELALAYLEEGRNAEALGALNLARGLFLALRMRPEVRELERRLRGLEEIYLQVIHAWGESIESKDRYTAGHCDRVARYACDLAEAVGFRGDDLEWLRMGAFVHDVGKTAVPPEVLNKPGRLTEEEWTLMKSHTVVGDAMIADLQFPWDLRPIVRNHHERWDGGGYPDGLAGEEIPLTARILCVADVFDALTTTRPYRPALSRPEALAIMSRDAGKGFDPAIFAVFLERMEGGAA